MVAEPWPVRSILNCPHWALCHHYNNHFFLSTVSTFKHFVLLVFSFCSPLRRSGFFLGSRSRWCLSGTKRRPGCDFFMRFVVIARWTWAVEMFLVPTDNWFIFHWKGETLTFTRKARLDRYKRQKPRNTPPFSPLLSTLDSIDMFCLSIHVHSLKS